MARSKYTPELARRICDVVAQTGSDRAGYEAGKISKATFYTWLEAYPDFSDGISAAKAEFQDACPEALIRQANKAFADYLFGRVTVTIKSRKTRVNDLGSELEESERSFTPAPPRWAIERVLGRFGQNDRLDVQSLAISSRYPQGGAEEHTTPEDYRQQELARLQLAEAAVFPMVQAGDLDAVDRWLRIVDLRSRLLGLNLPVADRPINEESATAIELEIIGCEGQEPSTETSESVSN